METAKRTALNLHSPSACPEPRRGGESSNSEERGNPVRESSESARAEKPSPGRYRVRPLPEGPEGEVAIQLAIVVKHEFQSESTVRCGIRLTVQPARANRR